jgi:hypothetical protein
VLTVAVAALATLAAKPEIGEPNKLMAGGLVGVFLESHLLSSLGRTLAFLLVGVTALISLIFATDWFFYDLVRGFRARDRAEDQRAAPVAEPEAGVEGPGIGADLLAVAAPLVPEEPAVETAPAEEPVPPVEVPETAALEEPAPPEETNGSREAAPPEDDAPLFREAPAAPRFAVPRNLAPDAEAELEQEMNQLGGHLQRVRSKILGSEGGRPAERTPAGDEGGDATYESAVEAVIAAGRASVSLLQRRLNLTYTQAHEMLDRMESEGVVGGYQGIKPRDVLVSAEEWAARRR